MDTLHRQAIVIIGMILNTTFFASIEPILEPMTMPHAEWIIIGAETGKRKDKVVPDRKWIKDIVEACVDADIPIFMKSSLADIWEEPLIQEFPEELKLEVNNV